MFKKKLYLLPSLFILVLTFCRDDSPFPKNIDKKIVGTWATIKQEYRYYDEHGQLLHEERDEAKTIFYFDGSNVTATYDTGGGMSGTYTISKINGKNYISLTQDTQTEQMEIISISASSMSWSTEKRDVQDVLDDFNTADYAVITVDFSKH